MSSRKDKLSAIPTNVITGFLGVGKSTAILHLLKQKPADERWAVLVNEFGEIGIDGSVLGGRESEDSGVFVSEVPGGCMCCAAGLPMQIAMNRLLSRSRPHRLIIEPTGLGHPKEVLAVLSADHYKDLLDLRATVTLVDARKVSDERYTQHPTFLQQLAIADVIVANKADQYQAKDFPALLSFLETDIGLDAKSVFQVSHGQLALEWLSAPAREHQLPHHHHHHETEAAVIDPEIPEAGYLSIDNQGEGFFSRGWIFKPEWTFNSQQLYDLLLGINAERLKGVFITDRGITAYNKADGVLTEVTLDECMDSRVECISADPAVFEGMEAALLNCVIEQAPSTLYSV
ncbi:CobW family GTP-binding protein [Spongiibacter marinus]|uniref:CobW family GTP-binding protein n=1 Tax=Spongiibacter marinus TaxID=354246 RepID=UPI0035688DDA